MIFQEIQIEESEIIIKCYLQNILEISIKQSQV